MPLFIRQRPGEFSFLRPLLFLLFFTLTFLYASAPTVYSGDSGLFSAASYFLGSAHPPAYPLYILLGKFFTFIPFGNIALKINILSAVFGALTALLAFETAFYITKNTVLSFIAPLMIFTSQNFILEASKAEVYTLNAFLIILIFYLCLKALREQSPFKYILTACFALGIGMGNHHTIVFMIIVILYSLIVRRKDFQLGIVALSLLLFFIGLSVYLHIYLRTISDAFIMYSRAFSLMDFKNIFLRTDYSSSSVQNIQALSVSSYSAWFYGAKNITTILVKEIHYISLFFVLIGLLGRFLKDRKTFLLILISMLIWLPLARLTISMPQPNYRQFFTIIPYFLQYIPLLGIIAAVGASTLYEKLQTSLPIVAKAVFAGSIILQIILIPIAMQKSSLSDFFLPYTWTKDVAKIVKPKSFFLAFGDNPSFLNFYAVGVERLRDDIFFLDTTSGSNQFRVTLAPNWKLSEMYPEFYKGSVTSIEYFYPIAREGRLYASSRLSVPENIQDKFDIGLYVLIAILKPKDYPLSITERFKEDFAKIDYLPIIYSHKPDYMAQEILHRYTTTIFKYAQIIGEENSKDTDFFYQLALYNAFGDPKYTILKDYLGFLAVKRSPLEAEKFIRKLEEAETDIETRSKLEELELWLQREYMNKSGK